MKTAMQIIWDWNGTLLDDAAACVKTINCMSQARGLRQIALLEYRQLFRFPVHHFYTALGYDLANEDWDKLADEYHACYRAATGQAALRDGALALVHRLHNKNYAQAVLSACEQSLLQTMLHRYDLVGFFNPVIGADNMDGASKEGLALRLQAQLKSRPDETLMIGDTDHDAHIAQQMGWHCVLLADGYQATDLLLATGAPVCESYPDLIAKLQADWNMNL